MSPTRNLLYNKNAIYWKYIVIGSYNLYNILIYTLKDQSKLMHFSILVFEILSLDYYLDTTNFIRIMTSICFISL